MSVKKELTDINGLRLEERMYNSFINMLVSIHLSNNE